MNKKLNAPIQIEIAAQLAYNLPFDQERLSYLVSKLLNLSPDRINVNILNNEGYIEVSPSKSSETFRLLLKILEQKKLLKPMRRPANHLVKLTINQYIENAEIDKVLRHLSSLIWIAFNEDPIPLRKINLYKYECELWLASDWIWAKLSSWWLNTFNDDY